MISKYIKGKVYVFIDVANIFYAQRTLGWRISYERLMNYFKRECRKLGLCFVFLGRFDHSARQQKFLDMLEINGYIVKTKPAKKIKLKTNKYKDKADVDVEMSFEMFDRAGEYKTAVILSGDSDFAFIVKRIKNLGRQVIVMSTRGHISRELIKLAKYIDFRKLRNEIELKNKPLKLSGESRAPDNSGH